MISAKIIADSKNIVGKRLTTFIVVFPRIVLAEFNTHRAFSRNSASSRAIPFEKMSEMVKTNPFIPIKFQKDHKGMQGTEYYDGIQHDACVRDWLKARDAAVENSSSFEFPVTKQIRNRLLEPFMWHTVIVTASEFENFFALRAHKDAEIHIEALAYEMLKQYNESQPKLLQPGEWHIPFGDKFEHLRLESAAHHIYGDKIGTIIPQFIYDEAKIKVAIARCARISYLNYEGNDDYAADIKLCDRLFGSSPKHLSPTEHVAQATDDDKFIGNFSGFKQYRYLFADQNLKDSRVKNA